MHSQHTHLPCQWPVARSRGSASFPAMEATLEGAELAPDGAAAPSLLPPSQIHAGRGRSSGDVDVVRPRAAHSLLGAAFLPALMPLPAASASQNLSCLAGGAVAGSLPVAVVDAKDLV